MYPESMKQSFGGNGYAASAELSYKSSASYATSAQDSYLTSQAYSTSLYGRGGWRGTKLCASNPLRIAHVSQFLLRAGIEYWLKALSRHSDPNRLQITRSVVTSDMYDPTMIHELGIPVEVGGSTSVQHAAANCDVMLASSPANLAALLGDVRPPLTVFVAHGDGEISRELLEQNASVIDHVIAVSHRVKNFVCDGFPTTVIPNCVDLAHIAQTKPREPAREALGFSPDDFVLGYVGRFSIEKRPEAVIEAATRLPREFKVLLVGWGPMRNELMEMANDLIPGRFVIVEGKGNLGDYYHAMDACCLLSRSEGFGLVILEAMLSGIPMISTPVGCAPEIIQDRVNGIVVTEDPASVAEAATMLQKHPQWASGLAAQGKAYADKHGHASVMCRQYEELLERLCAEKKLPRKPERPVPFPSFYA